MVKEHLDLLYHFVLLLPWFRFVYYGRYVGDRLGLGKLIHFRICETLLIAT